jgi:hypothetical protein
VIDIGGWLLVLMIGIVVLFMMSDGGRPSR